MPILIQQHIMLLIQQSNTLLLSFDTANYYMNILLWTQQAITFVLYSYWYHNLICLYTLITITSYYVTISSLIQPANTLQYSYWYNNPICYYTPTDTANSYVMTYYLIQQAIPQSLTSIYSYDTASYKLLYPYRHSKLLCYPSPIDTTSYDATLRYYIPMIQQHITPLFHYCYQQLLWH